MTSSEELHDTGINSSDDIIMKELHNLTFLQEQWDFFALVGLASSWLGVLAKSRSLILPSLD